MMVELLIQALVASKNEAADELLLEALRVGNEREQLVVLDALFFRKTTRGLSGVIERYASLPDSLKLRVLSDIKVLHHALRECGRSENSNRRMGALKLIALGRQGKLAYVLSENLHDQDEGTSKAAVDALVGLARWVATESRKLQAGLSPEEQSAVTLGGELTEPEKQRARIYNELVDQRPEIEQTVARAMDIHRGKQGQELLRAALLLCDWPGSKTLAILHTPKHGGQSPMVRRLQQPPASEHVEAFLLGGSHGQLRSHFGTVFAHIDEAPVLDALLRKTHWVKDHQLQLCLHQVTRGTWWNDGDLAHDIERRDVGDAARIGEWIVASGVPDDVQDERLEQLRIYIVTHGDSFEAKLRLLRIAARRPKRASTALLKQFLTDSDERLMRMAAREIVRRRPTDSENLLLQLMTSAPASVRRVVSRSIGQAGFEHFWQRFDRLDPNTRKGAGRAMLKMLPDASQRLSRKLLSGPVEQRLKAMQIAHELGIAESLRPALAQLCTDGNAKLRSKAISVLGELPVVAAESLLERTLVDADPRVRANAIEVLEHRQDLQFLPLLAQRARSPESRERANAIKALHRMRVKNASGALVQMLRDERPEHRISALWALRKIGWWQMLGEVGKLAKDDGNVRVRRYALGVLKAVADLVQRQKEKAAG